MGKAEEDLKKRRRAALQAWAENATDDQLRNAKAAQMATSYGLEPKATQEILNGQRRWRAQRKAEQS
jgi:hypothetical protein